MDFNILVLVLTLVFYIMFRVWNYKNVNSIYILMLPFLLYVYSSVSSKVDNVVLSEPITVVNNGSLSESLLTSPFPESSSI